MMDSQAVDTQAFLDAFMTLMQECAMPLFEEAKTYAQGAGLSVRLELHGAEKANPGLCLLVAYPDTLHEQSFNSCCITADPAQQKILHEDFYNDSNQLQRQQPAPSTAWQARLYQPDGAAYPAGHFLSNRVWVAAGLHC